MGNKTLSHTLTQELIDLINDLQQVPGPEQFREEILSSLETLFDASDSVILDWTPFKQGARTMSREDMFFHKGEKKSGWDYPKVHHLDPIFDWIESRRCHDDLNVTRLSDLKSFREIKKTSFYTDILEPLNCRYVITMAAHQGEHILASISVIRPPGSHDFSRADVQLARLINPILANAYSHLILKRQSSLKDDIFEIVVQQIQHHPFVLFSSNMDSVYRSEKMSVIGTQLSHYGNSIRDIFDKSPVIAKHLALFSSKNPASHRRLPENLTDTVKVSKSKVVHIGLEFFNLGTDRRYLLATLKLDGINKPLDNLQRDYGLTSREHQIAQLAATGLDSAALGHRLAISRWSVKSHLRNIYKKTGVNSRTQLAQILSR